MGEANGTRRGDGDDHEPDGGAPRHLVPPRRFTPPRYVLGYGATAVDPPPAPAARGALPPPAWPTPSAGREGPPPPGVTPAAGVPIGPAGGPAPPPTGSVPPARPDAQFYDHGYVEQDYVEQDYVAQDYVDHGDDGAYDEHRYDGDGAAGPWHDGAEGRRHKGEVGASLRTVGSEVAWRYRSAPLWARITADIAAASLLLALIVGASLALRQDGEPPEIAANRTSTSSPVTTTTAPPTTTTTVPPTTTTTEPPTTTTTVPPTTTTTVPPPVVPPPTAPPTTPSTVPPTTTTEQVHYRDCSEAWFADALPLFQGEPGYRPGLDRDGDGEACEWDERRD